MTPEQREELKKVAQNAVDTQIGGWPFHGQVFKRLTTPGAILSLIAQVEALTVPQVYIVEADYNHDGNQAVRAFSCKADAETFAAALNAYQESEPRTSWGDAEHKAWAAAHPVPEFLAADGFDIVDVPFGLPTIPAIPGTKEGA